MALKVFRKRRKRELGQADAFSTQENVLRGKVFPLFQLSEMRMSIAMGTAGSWRCRDLVIVSTVPSRSERTLALYVKGSRACVEIFYLNRQRRLELVILY